MLTDVPDSLPFLLHDVARQIRFAFEARTRSIGVTRPQYRVLSHLARTPGLTQSELADLLDVERITLGRMVDRMSDAGLVERRADPADRRVWRLHMLPAAMAVVDRLGEIGHEVEEEALAFLDAPARIALSTSLTQLRDGMRTAREKAQVAA